MKRILFAILFVLLAFSNAYGIVATTTTYIPNTKITAAALNANNNNLVNAINNIDSGNIVNASILGIDIHAGTIAASNMYCSGYWSTLTNCGGTGAVDANALHTHSGTALLHGNLSSATSTMHSDYSILFTATGTTFATTTDNVHEALTSLATFVGYASSATSTTLPIRSAGYAYHATTAGSCTVTVPAYTATSTILVILSANLTQNTAVMDSYIPLKISYGGTDYELSSSISPNSLFHLYTGNISRRVEQTMILNSTTYAAFNTAKVQDITIGFGTLWESGGSTTITDYQMFVEVQ